MIQDRLLANGVGIPSFGLGGKVIHLGDVESEKKQYDIYCYALSSEKCRLYDTSESYGINEDVLGNALYDTGKRKDVMLISKVGNKSQRDGDIRKALENSLERLKTDYLDLYLIHWPQTGTFIDTWRELESFYSEGLVKAIGVCNFKKHHFAQLKQAECKILPMVNEIEVHPLLAQYSEVQYCIANGIQIIAYSPFARMHDVLIKSNPIRTLGKKYDKTAAQVILRWHYQSGRVAIPQTLNENHFDEMYDIEDFELSEREIAWINSLDDNVRVRYNSDNCDFSAL